ncbi:MAG: hypothetical protein NTV70_18405 [Acidobacteria bacterium]|nr:hypothetical protein [Acidobacteriota bacterium]
MFACLFGTSPLLAELAGQFSPLLELTAPDTVVFSLAGLARLFGDTHQLASEVSRRGQAMGIQANLAIARNPDAAVVAARHLRGVTIIAPGDEAAVLGRIAIQHLPADPVLIDTLLSWGIRTFGEFAALPAMGIAERLGEAGTRLRLLACGQLSRPLQVAAPPEDYTARQELEHPVELLEPLLFVVSALVRDLTARLARQSLSTNRITLRFTLIKGEQRTRSLEFPVALRDPMVLLKQVQLDLEAHPIKAAIQALEVTLHPAETRSRQDGLFVPTAPEPEKLQLLIARLGALVGPEHVGTPALLDTHRPDAYQLRPCAFEPVPGMVVKEPGTLTKPGLQLAFRYFRPPLEAAVELQHGAPRRVRSQKVAGVVCQTAGPWRTSGEWWASTAWNRDEWDIALDTGGLYRLYCVHAPQRANWFLDGSYD